MLVVAAAFAFLIPVVRSEQAQKSPRPTPEDRLNKLEARADAAEKAAAGAAMEKDYILRTQKLYESYYQRTLSTELWTLGIVTLLLTAVFGLVARFSLNLFEQRTRLATTDATAQLRNEYGRILAKEVQKLWDSNAADNRKLKEALSAQSAELEHLLNARCDFQMQFVQGLAGAAEAHSDDALTAFRQAVAAYKSGKSRNLIEAKMGATAVRYIFELLRKKHGENCEQRAREELSEPIYSGLEEELALAALQSPWLTPLINERVPPSPEPPAPEPAPEARPSAVAPATLHAEIDPGAGEEMDSCRLINN